ncbi:MAG: EF-P beta-lysylation protein EpmB [Gammaproteobacteria bacterium]|nr:EF-P beta-lysylation protein EpmB [Gammaproteobacteria bacterium]
MATASSLSRPFPAGPVTRWQHALRAAVTDPAELLALLGLDPALVPPALAAARHFSLRVPRGFIARMRHGDPADPLLLQVLPRGAELLEAAGFSADPLGEAAAHGIPGLLHKYHGRALLVTTGACGVQCRYCFRREFPYDEIATGNRWGAALTAIAADSSIEEVILSGGDPLSLSDARLHELAARLATIPHLRRLRLHTRQPIVLPERIDEGLLSWIGALRWPLVMVLHANHANEIDSTVAAALAALRARGVTLLNQSVLLAGVNDSAATLAALSMRLFDCGVLPYYLHLLDRVRGTSHFEVADARARTIMGELAALLPGYLVPRLAREVPGAPAKQVLAPEFAAGQALERPHRTPQPTRRPE